MKKTAMIAIAALLLTAAGAGLSYARQGGRGNGNGGWNCPYRSTTGTTAGSQQSGSGWYCPRSGTWTTTRNQLGPMNGAGGYGYGRTIQNQNSEGR